MEEGSPKKSVYNEPSVQIATFLGGPIVAGYLLATNFRVLGNNALSRKTWYVTILGIIFLAFFLYLVPDLMVLPAFIISIFFTVISAFVLLKFQTDSLKKHISSGGSVFPLWRAVLLGVFGFLLSFFLKFLLSPGVM